MGLKLEYYRHSVEEVLEKLSSDRESGLSEVDSKKRLIKVGLNLLAEAPHVSKLLKFLSQFTEFIIVVLIGAALIAAALGEFVDAIAILAIVILNGVLGYSQEEKAERVMEALKKLSAPTAKCIREGKAREIDASGLVPGDIIMLESGDNVPADVRLIESHILKIDEAPLTGESLPVLKNTDLIEIDTQIADKINMAFMGTTVVYGRARGVVTNTGMSTEMGSIAEMLKQVEAEQTPLQVSLSEFARLLVYLAGGICSLIFFIGMVRGENLLNMFLTAVSLAVAAIPEGLPAVVTISLALGVQRMVKKNALVRKLPSIETLGSATVIASDKTGTITQNEMTVKKIYLPFDEVSYVSGSGYRPVGEIKSSGRLLTYQNNDGLRRLAQIAFLCNGAQLTEHNSNWSVTGDPTEGALITLAIKAGLSAEGVRANMDFIGEVPFDENRRMMSVVYATHHKNGTVKYLVLTKGAPASVLAKVGGQIDKEVQHMNELFASEAMRVLAFAYKESDTPFDMNDIEAIESDLTFTGLTAMIDPPREGVDEAVARAKKSGIVPIMITGDHKITATAIARDVGIFVDGDLALSGDELEMMPDSEFIEKLPLIKVYARVNPEHKLKIVKAWKDRGDTIAMTGDGVNDAPALKAADIGIAMGISGTDVTKEASDMVLTDDNFASIVDVVEEGRGIFSNIRKVVHFLLSCNIGEIITLLVASIVGMPLPLLPVQILWTNLVTDGLPAIGLAMEKVEKGVMDKKPRPKSEGIVTNKMMWIMLLQGMFMATCTLVVYWAELNVYDASLEKARTMAFTVLVFCQKFHVYNCRSEVRSVFSVGLFSNNMLTLSVLLIIVSQVAIVYYPFLQDIFQVTVLNQNDWTMVIVASIQPLVWMEVVKVFMSKRVA